MLLTTDITTTVACSTSPVSRWLWTLRLGRLDYCSCSTSPVSGMPWTLRLGRLDYCSCSTSPVSGKPWTLRLGRLDYCSCSTSPVSGMLRTLRLGRLNDCSCSTSPVSGMPWTLRLGRVDYSSCWSIFSPLLQVQRRGFLFYLAVWLDCGFVCLCLFYQLMFEGRALFSFYAALPRCSIALLV